MKISLRTLRALISEALSSTHTTVRSAPTDKDADVPGHLPEELPSSVGDMDEEAWVPGRWMPGEGEPVKHKDLDRFGANAGMDDGMEEADARVMGDGDDEGISSHLKSDTQLGEPGEHDL